MHTSPPKQVSFIHMYSQRLLSRLCLDCSHALSSRSSHQIRGVLFFQHLFNCAKGKSHAQFNASSPESLLAYNVILILHHAIPSNTYKTLSRPTSHNIPHFPSIQPSIKHRSEYRNAFPRLKPCGHPSCDSTRL